MNDSLFDLLQKPEKDIIDMLPQLRHDDHVNLISIILRASNPQYYYLIEPVIDQLPTDKVLLSDILEQLLHHTSNVRTRTLTKILEASIKKLIITCDDLFVNKDQLGFSFIHKVISLQNKTLLSFAIQYADQHHIDIFLDKPYEKDALEWAEYQQWKIGVDILTKKYPHRLKQSQENLNFDF